MSHPASPTVFWFRRDLRLDDQPALCAAAQGAPGVVGLFVADDALLQPSGAPRRAFLAGSLAALDERMGGRLLVLHGRPETVVPRVAAAVGAAAVHAAADFGPYGRRRDQAVEQALAEQQIEFVRTGSAYAVAPGRVRKPDGTPYSVFAPFHRVWLQHGWRAPATSAAGVAFVDPGDVHAGRRYRIDSLAAPVPASTELPQPGEAAALERWQHYVSGVAGYGEDRNRPDLNRTSRMSPYLKWGCIHPRTMLADLARHRSAGAEAYRRELGFREFYADVLLHHPDSPRVSLDPVIDRLQWDSGPTVDRYLQAWKDGRTGFPYIDAGMRQLLAEGWIHNRVRMGVASFLIKDLHLAWQIGARHFMQHLVDGDVASNTHGWQWVAGSGSQAQPYYRIFNPIGQGERFDPDGDYVRRYVPELAGVPGKAVHRPWDLPGGLPDGYPAPIVDHAAERAESLHRWEQRT
ncbi:cryptochrome/photolyase family protein [Nakamurella endophytica]|uniref:Deoxyribodipyrimidine photo-lyase n=1 Tax=Nakamurella endophytica TaxID=1748367 RepID=A0A917SMN4_9ACTN|nr:deoxyribodipyrimidine photo-lyase [Nakamurella endophytica]GGL88580.1 deoxyribodipyrimidine photo-lyase [Nakamurella endophytica]